ncbi:MAG: hypothetical protein H0Z35_05695 [Thermoanaerobacteraceae bacterium]|nr:hypothetical protein [Thermoanaerobacteraceae bacterium]
MAKEQKPVPLMLTYYKPETEHQKHAATFMAYVMFIALALISVFLMYQFT